MDSEKANGSIMTLFGNIYLQIDYDSKGQQSVEKILIMDNEDGIRSNIQLVFGPYSEKIETQQLNWEKWLEEIKIKSEAN